MALIDLLRCNFQRIVLAALVTASIAGCGNSNGIVQPPPPGSGDVNGTFRSALSEHTQVCSANMTSGTHARWTLLVYMNAANNLQPDSLTNMAQMATIGSDTNLNIVVQWKQSRSTDSGTPSFFETRRYFLHKHTAPEINAINNGDTTSLDPDRLANPGTNRPVVHGTFTDSQSDMGDFRVLSDFVQWGTTNYPADHLAVLIWDHGSGWRNAYRSVNINKLVHKFRAVSQDNETNNEIETWELPAGLASHVQPIDMLIFDCSLEQMVEVAYEVRNSARIMVGSEDSPPGAGYPYDKWLTDLKASGANPCAIGNNIIDRFIANYTTQDDVTQSIIDLSKMDSTASALNTLGFALNNHRTDQAVVIQNARQNAHNYQPGSVYDANKDLYDYVDRLRTTSTSADIQQAAANLQNVLRGTGGAIISSSHGSFADNSGKVFQAGSNGLAIYVPVSTDFLTTYNNLALSRVAPSWTNFLQHQVQ